MKPGFVVGILVAVTLLAVLPGKAAASPATPSGLVPGDIYVTDDSANAVFRIDPTTGTQTLVTSGGALGFPLGIAIGPDGNLWVASGNWVPTSTSEAAVVRVDPDTGTQTVVSTDDQFEFPSGIAFAPDGDLYVTDQGSAATGVTTADGSLFRVDPVSGAQALISHGDLLIDPVDLAFAPDGSLFVVDWGGGTDGAVIQVDVTTGDQTLVSSGGYFVNPNGLAIASDGSILVADQIVRSSTNDGKIIRVDPEDGTQTVAYSSDKLYDPSDLAFEDGTIVVADFNKRVVRIDVDSGTQTILSSGGAFKNPFAIVVVPPPGEGCPRTPGYWKNHPDAWPVDSLTIGGKVYTMAELMTLLKTPVRTDASLILAHQLIAAKLNLADGTDPASITGTLWDADALLADYAGRLPLRVPASGSAGQEMVGLAYTLDLYNNDVFTPGCVGTS